MGDTQWVGEGEGRSGRYVMVSPVPKFSFLPPRTGAKPGFSPYRGREERRGTGLRNGGRGGQGRSGRYVMGG